MSLLLQNYVPALKYGAKILSSEILGYGLDSFHNILFVDGDNGSDSNNGTTPTSATATVVAAAALASAGDTIFVKPRKITAGATDPVSYTENLTITSSQAGLKIVGMGVGLTQGSIPQLKVGATTTSPIITINAAGVAIGGLGINGIGGTGGGVLLNTDATGAVTDAFGANFIGNHFKNCVGTTATDCRTGGAINWTANGGSWQVRIQGNTFYKNVGDVVLKGTSVSVPQDVIIADNNFQGIATAVDCHLFLTGGGSGMLGVTVDHNIFADVLPALSSGSIVRYADMTGCTGIFSNNRFGGSYTTSGFGAAKAAAKIPTTVGISGNYSDAGLIVREA